MRDFQRLISEDVEAMGMETMENFKTRILQGIIQQDIEGLGLDEKA